MVSRFRMNKITIVIWVSILLAFAFIAANNIPSLRQSSSEPTEIAGNQTVTQSKYLQDQYDNLLLGHPGAADVVVDRPGYALGYIEYHKQAAWVAYIFTAEEVTVKVAQRADRFREDPNIPSGSATLGDYRGSGYDRGHLAPAADMAFSEKTMSDSFYMSNMSPQRPEFNRGVWKRLEIQVRLFAITEEKIFVVTGPVLSEEKSITIGSSQVTVPRFYYKVVYDMTPPEKMIGFILPNEGSRKDLRDFAVTVDTVEELTGLDFFNNLPKDKQEKLESSISPDDWKWMK